MDTNSLYSLTALTLSLVTLFISAAVPPILNTMNPDDIQVLILQNFATVYYDLRFFVNNFFTKGIDDLSVERPKSTQIMHQNIANVYFTIRYPGTVIKVLLNYVLF